MRTALITLQATIITLIAVFGANSETDRQHACPLPSAQADVECRN